MEEGQERDSSSDEARVVIEDEGMEDSQTDTPGLTNGYFKFASYSGYSSFF